jgi:hypothetical protein
VKGIRIDGRQQAEDGTVQFAQKQRNPEEGAKRRSALNAGAWVVGVSILAVSLGVDEQPRLAVGRLLKAFKCIQLTVEENVVPSGPEYGGGGDCGVVWRDGVPARRMSRHDRGCECE